jgi:hypothetical protein
MNQSFTQSKAEQLITQRDMEMKLLERELKEMDAERAEV